MNTYWVKVAKSTRHSQWLYWRCFFSGKSCWVMCRAGHWVLWSLLLYGWYWYLYSLSFFLAVSVYTSDLPVSELGETEVGLSCSALKGWGSWLLTLYFFFQWQEHFLAGEFFLVMITASLGDGMMKEKWSNSSFNFCGCFQLLCLFVSLCSWNFLSRLLSSPRTVLICG